MFFQRRPRVQMSRRPLVQMSVLRHSLELFRGCQLNLELDDPKLANRGWMEDPEEVLPYLSLLASARPFCIDITHSTESPGLQADVLLREPIMLTCPKLILTFYSKVPQINIEIFFSKFPRKNLKKSNKFSIPPPVTQSAYP